MSDKSSINHVIEGIINGVYLGKEEDIMKLPLWKAIEIMKACNLCVKGTGRGIKLVNIPEL